MAASLPSFHCGQVPGGPEAALTPAELAQAASRLQMAGFELGESPQLPIGRALQASVHLNR